MRSPLTRLAAGLVVVCGFGAPAGTAVVPPPTVDRSPDAAEPFAAGPLGADLPASRVLPVSGADLPVVTVGPAEVEDHAFPLPPTVQAIPTPTAFHAGVVVLAAVAVFRRVTRWRRPA